MLVQPEELKSELYPEILDEITRGDTDEVLIQIKAAEDFCKSYLFKFDLKALFGVDAVTGDNPTPAIAPTVVDENLKKCVKIVASYWLVRKSSPNVSVDLFREDYELMIGNRETPGWLTQIKEGYLVPAWPYAVDNPDTPEVDESQNSSVNWSSNTKRTNSF
jgi:hypothetical protein